jgi:hypothetical protein
MQKLKHSVGDPIEARCTKCRKNSAHTILSLDDEVPALVECGICNRQHAFRKPTTVKKSAARQSVQVKAAEQKEWERLRPEMNRAKAKDYSMTADYKVKALINHPVFGLGVVQRVIGSQKVEILFEDGKKTMRCK